LVSVSAVSDELRCAAEVLLVYSVIVPALVIGPVLQVADP